MSERSTPFEPISRPLRLAQIGAGYWGANLIRVIASLEGLERFMVCDMDRARLAKFKLQYPKIETGTDAGAVIADPGVDAVVLAVPAADHHRLARAALLAGKHVFVEKPLATTLEDSEDLVRLAETQRRMLMVGHTFLYNDAVARVKEYIDAGELGQVYYILAQRLNLGKVREDVNAWWNLAPHDISIILHWLGETPESVAAQGFTFLQPGIEDVVFASLSFASGAAAHIHVSWLDPVKTRRMVVVGSKKMLVYDDTVSEGKITLYDKGIDKKNIIRSLPDLESYAGFHFENRSGDVLIPHFPFKEPLSVELRHFMHCIREGAQPRTDGRAGLEVVRVLEEAQRCLDARAK